MDRKEQLLVIDPQSELRFWGPFNQSITSFIRLTNPTDKTILFKIKTTAPKKYCVRPNSGFLLPNETTQISISLQPFHYDPNEKNKHKFMVQSLVIPDGEEEQFDFHWKKATPEQLMDSKLRCVFELPVDKQKPAQPTSTTVSQPSSQGTNVSEAQTTVTSNAEFTSADPPVDIARYTAEMRHLRDEESKMRQENLQLQEQILRLRMAADRSTKETAGYQNPYSPPPPVANNLMPMIYIAIIMAILGVILGKYLL